MYSLFNYNLYNINLSNGIQTLYKRGKRGENFSENIDAYIHL